MKMVPRVAGSPERPVAASAGRRLGRTERVRRGRRRIARTALTRIQKPGWVKGLKIKPGPAAVSNPLFVITSGNCEISLTEASHWLRGLMIETMKILKNRMP